jgi:hypothetical protein
LILNDIAEVLYAPAKAFKRILENPKYLGAFLVLLLFFVVAIGYETVTFSKVYVENTSPTVNEFAKYTNATYWQASENVAVSNNYSDYFNYSIYVSTFGLPATDSRAYYNIFSNYTKDIGPSSLQINGTNVSNISAAIGSVFNIDCSSNGFQNLSMVIKEVTPNAAPHSATLTLYSINDADSFKYDLTSSLTSTSDWQNLTIPLGSNAQGWTSSGSPNWSNITSIKLDLVYPSGSNVNVHIGALFFRGQYVQNLNSGILYTYLSMALQVVFTWFILTAIIYLFFKGLKTDVIWKPLLIAIGFSTAVMIIRELVNLVAALAMPMIYLPYDITFGAAANLSGLPFPPQAIGQAIFYPVEALGRLTPASQAAATLMTSQTGYLGIVAMLTLIVSYVWLGFIVSNVIGTMKPEFSMGKKLGITAGSIIITIVIILLVLSIPI